VGFAKVHTARKLSPSIFALFFVSVVDQSAFSGRGSRKCFQQVYKQTIVSIFVITKEIQLNS